MYRNQKLAAVAAVFLLGVVGMGGAVGADNDKEKERAKNIEAGYVDAKELLRLMDKDKNGKVSKQEFMSFMEAEFERLDVDHNGELDVTELTRLKVSKHPGGTGGR